MAKTPTKPTLEKFPGLDLSVVPADAEWVPVKLDGPSDDDPVYLVPTPLPLSLSLGSSRWSLSDRAAGLYIPVR